MGFLDHLFKTKQNGEKTGDGEKGTAPDPGAFLQPKYFGPRGASLPLPSRPAASAAQAPAPPPHGHEIVLTLGDVLSRIPTPLLQAGLHDASRELRFSMDDLSADIARGRAAVPLSKIAALCPDVFARELEPGDDTEIRLPLQKLVEQIGLLRTRPAVPPPEPVAPEAAPAKDLPPASETPPAAETTPEPPAPPASEPAAEAHPSVHVFTPPPPPITAEAAPAAPPQNHVPEPGGALVDTTPLPVFRLHPPPVVRPVLVLPPTLLAVSAPPPVPVAPAPEPPPHFPQEALRALFPADEKPDLAAVSRHTAALAGVRACALEVRGEKALAGDAPDGFDLATLHAAAARFPDAGALPVGAWENVTLHGDQAAISFFTRPGVLLAVLHDTLASGVRERLATIATALAQR